MPLVAAVAGVLLWRQKDISRRGESSGGFLFRHPYLLVFSPFLDLSTAVSDLGHDIL